jgi:chromosome segregation ATPase
VLLKDSIQGLTNKVSEQEELIARLTEELRSVRKEIEGKDREMEELASMYESYVNREVRAVEVQTIDRRVLAVAVQTEEGEGRRRRGRGEKEHRESHSKGKAKTKNIKIQTDHQEEYVPVKKHSKSFERVMKSHIVNS